MILTRAKRTSSVLLIGVAITGAGLWTYHVLAAPPKPEEGKLLSPEQRELQPLLKARRETAEKAYVAWMKRVEIAPSVDRQVCLRAAKSLLKAELELSANRAERVKAHEDQLQRMTDWAGKVKQLEKAGLASAAESLQAEYHRLDAEIELKRARSR
jgi:hypothetical protein